MCVCDTHSLHIQLMVVPPSALVIVCFLLTPVRSTLVNHGDSQSQGVTVILKSSGPNCLECCG